MNITGRPIYQKQAKLSKADERAAKAYMIAVKSMPCAACTAPGPSDAHHCCCRPMADDATVYIREPAAGRKASDFDCIPLCKECHQNGPHAIHQGKASWVEAHGPDYGFLPLIRAVAGVSEIVGRLLK